MQELLRQRSIAFYLLLHALLFLGLYQVGFTPDEWSEVATRARKLGVTTTQALAPQGAWGLLRAYYRTDSDERLYREYANLSLFGRADFAYIAAKQYSAQAVTAKAPAIPYRDVRVEYPPLALLFGMIPPRLVSGASYEAYRFALGTWLWLLHGVNLLLVLGWMRARGAEPRDERRLLQASLIFCLLLGNIVVTRIDHLVVLCLLLGVVCIERSLAEPGQQAWRWALGTGAIAGIGALTKIVPALIVPAACIVWYGAQHSYRMRLSVTALVSCGLTVFAIHGLSWLLFGPGYLATFGYHAERGIQLESSYASGLLLMGWAGFPLSLELSFGSSNVVSSADALLKSLAPLLLMGTTLAMLITAWRARASDASCVVATLVLVFITTNKVFSPQYLLWPALLVCGVAFSSGRKQLVVLLLVSAALSQVLYPRGYAALKQFSPPLVAVLALRNALVISLTVMMWRLSLRSPAQPRTRADSA